MHIFINACTYRYEQFVTAHSSTTSLVFVCMCCMCTLSQCHIYMFMYTYLYMHVNIQSSPCCNNLMIGSYIFIECVPHTLSQCTEPLDALCIATSGKGKKSAKCLFKQATMHRHVSFKFPHTETHRNTLQCTVTYCNTLQYSVMQFAKDHVSDGRRWLRLAGSLKI